jgi:hypothetical protein
MDIANDLLHCQDWNPNLLGSPHNSKIADPIIKEPGIEFVSAKPLDINMEEDGFGKIIYLYDGIAITPELNDNRHRAIQAMLLAINTICRPSDPNKPIKHNDCLSLGKLEEEG